MKAHPSPSQASASSMRARRERCGTRPPRPPLSRPSLCRSLGGAEKQGYEDRAKAERAASMKEAQSATRRAGSEGG
jgi:hypothetical protein